MRFLDILTLSSRALTLSLIDYDNIMNQENKQQTSKRTQKTIKKEQKIKEALVSR